MEIIKAAAPKTILVIAITTINSRSEKPRWLFPGGIVLGDDIIKKGS
jgi:hypothetical protein